MRLTLDRSECGYYKLLQSDAICTKESAELVIPDVCEDVGQILDVKGEICLTNKKLIDGRLSVEGAVEVCIVYAGEDGKKLEHVATTMQFTQTKAMSDAGDDHLVVVRLELRRIEAKTLNPRKLLIKAEPCAVFCCYGIADCGVYNRLPAGEFPAIHTLCKKAQFVPVISVKEKNFSISDEYLVPADVPAGAKMISSATRICVDDIKTVGSKIIFKIVTETDALFLCEETGELRSCCFETQVSQLIESEYDTELTEAAVIPVLKSSELTRLPERENSACYAASFSILVQAVCCENRCVEYVADAYCNKYCASTEFSETVLGGYSTIRRMRMELCGRLPAGLSCADVVYLTPSYAFAEVSGSKLMCSVRLRGVYCSPEGERLPLSISLEDSDELIISDCQSLKLISCCVGSAFIAQSCDVTIPFIMELGVYEEHSVNSVSAIELDEGSCGMKNRPSIIVLCSNRDYDLWELAKKYGSTTTGIEKANTIDGKFDISARPMIIPKD